MLAARCEQRSPPFLFVNSIATVTEGRDGTHRLTSYRAVSWQRSRNLLHFKFWRRGGIIMAISGLVKQTSVQEALVTLRKDGVKARYENFIGGTWVAPLKGKYFTDYSPING